MTADSTPFERPFEKVVNELCRDEVWDLIRHFEGCFAALEAFGPSRGAAVHLALDAIEGAVYDAEVKGGNTLAGELGDQQKVNPRTLVGVPYFFLYVLATLWRMYKSAGGSIGQVFALEGPQGTRPIVQQMNQLRDERAIVRWVARRIGELRAQGVQSPLEHALQDASQKFAKSYETILRYWKRFRELEHRLAGRGAQPPGSSDPS